MTVILLKVIDLGEYTNSSQNQVNVRIAQLVRFLDLNQNLKNVFQNHNARMVKNLVTIAMKYQIATMVKFSMTTMNAYQFAKKMRS